MMTKDAVRIEPKVLKIGKCLSKKSLANLQSIAWRGDSCKAEHEIFRACNRNIDCGKPVNYLWRLCKVFA